MARTGGGSSLLLGVAVVTVGAFLWWLYTTSRAVEGPVSPELAEQGDGDDVELVEVSPQVLLQRPEAAMGAEAVLRGAVVSERLGRGAFTVQADSASRYPVLLTGDLIARDTEVYGQDRVTVYGRVFTLNDSIRAEWVSRGAVDAGNEGAIPATSSFLLADSLSFN